MEEGGGDSQMLLKPNAATVEDNSSSGDPLAPNTPRPRRRPDVAGFPSTVLPQPGYDLSNNPTDDSKPRRRRLATDITDEDGSEPNHVAKALTFAAISDTESAWVLNPSKYCDSPIPVFGGEGENCLVDKETGEISKQFLDNVRDRHEKNRVQRNNIREAHLKSNPHKGIKSKEHHLAQKATVAYDQGRDCEDILVLKERISVELLASCEQGPNLRTVGLFLAFQSPLPDETQSELEGVYKKLFNGENAEPLSPSCVHALRNIIEDDSTVDIRLRVSVAAAQKDVWTKRCHPEVKHLFVCSSCRSHNARLGFGVNNDASNFLSILIVEPSQFELYRERWGGEHVIISLPADDQGIGYARFWVQRLANEWGIQLGVLADDSILYFHDKSRKTHVDILGVMESLISDKQKFESQGKMVAQMGLARERHATADAHLEYRIFHATSFVLCDFKMLRTNGLQYLQDARELEDVILSAQCHLKKLLVLQCLFIEQKKLDLSESSLIRTKQNIGYVDPSVDQIHVEHLRSDYFLTERGRLPYSAKFLRSGNLLICTSARRNPSRSSVVNYNGSSFSTVSTRDSTVKPMRAIGLDGDNYATIGSSTTSIYTDANSVVTVLNTAVNAIASLDSSQGIFVYAKKKTLIRYKSRQEESLILSDPKRGAKVVSVHTLQNYPNSVAIRCANSIVKFYDHRNTAKAVTTYNKTSIEKVDNIFAFSEDGSRFLQHHQEDRSIEVVFISKKKNSMRLAYGNHHVLSWAGFVTPSSILLCFGDGLQALWDSEQDVLSTTTNAIQEIHDALAFDAFIQSYDSARSTTLLSMAHLDRANNLAVLSLRVTKSDRR